MRYLGFTQWNFQTEQYVRIMFIAVSLEGVSLMHVSRPVNPKFISSEKEPECIKHSILRHLSEMKFLDKM